MAHWIDTVGDRRTLNRVRSLMQVNPKPEPEPHMAQYRWAPYHYFATRVGNRVNYCKAAITASMTGLAASAAEHMGANAPKTHDFESSQLTIQ